MLLRLLVFYSGLRSITYRILLTMFDNLNAAGGVARSVKQRDSAGVGHIVFAALEASIKRAVGQVIVYGRLIDGHLANAIGKKTINRLMNCYYRLSNFQTLTALSSMPRSWHPRTKVLDSNAIVRCPPVCSVHKVFLWH